MIDVVIPVGPNPSNVRWLEQCFKSVRDQETVMEINVIIVDDAPHVIGARTHLELLAEATFGKWLRTSWQVFTNPWNLGVAASLNIGAGLGKGDFIMTLASDDWLEPTCIDEGIKAYLRQPDPLGHYYYSLNYWNEHTIESVNRTACMNALISRVLWETVGGLPPESCIGYEDKFFMSILYTHYKDHMIPVKNEIGLWNHRLHPEQFFRTRKSHLEGAIQIAIDYYMEKWQPRVAAGVAAC